MTFEEALARLEAAVEALERGDLPLEEALRRYEEGVRYYRHCVALLQQAEQRILELQDVNEHGQPVLRPFGPGHPAPATGASEDSGPTASADAGSRSPG
ncbi:MAG: exodeoxyribonuclease VII small subunit [Gemmataceae bacterium]